MSTRTNVGPVTVVALRRELQCPAPIVRPVVRKVVYLGPEPRTTPVLPPMEVR